MYKKYKFYSMNTLKIKKTEIQPEVSHVMQYLLKKAQ